VSLARLAEGYEAVRLPRVEAFAWRPAVAWLREVLRDGARLHDWAGREARAAHVGRGTVHVVTAPLPGPDGRSRWAVRHYRRGGAVARVVRDLYWGVGRPRPERELEASLHARAQGVPTPAVIAGAVYRVGARGAAGAYRADLVTEEIPDARSLASALAVEDAPAREYLQRAGALVRTLARAGLMHPDVSTGNVLLDGGGEPWVVDLDRARRRPGPSERAGRTMLARLERSLRKLGRAGGTTLGPQEWIALRSGFTGDS